jgi:hypothetical protein
VVVDNCAVAFDRFQNLPSLRAEHANHNVESLWPDHPVAQRLQSRCGHLVSLPGRTEFTPPPPVTGKELDDVMRWPGGPRLCRLAFMQRCSPSAPSDRRLPANATLHCR